MALDKPRTIAVISAGLSNPSSTRLLADILAGSAASALRHAETEVDVEVIELRELAHAMTDHLLTGFPSAELGLAYEQIRRADAVIAVTPVFSASYSGLFKTFIDLLEPGLLDGKPVLIAATAGTARHSLVLEHALRPLFAHLHAVVIPTAVFAATDDFGADAGLRSRADRAAAELAALVGGAPAVAPKRELVEDRFAQVTDFETLLRQASDGSSAR